jgi:hypothetical protein
MRQKRREDYINTMIRKKEKQIPIIHQIKKAQENNNLLPITNFRNQYMIIIRVLEKN